MKVKAMWYYKSWRNVPTSWCWRVNYEGGGSMSAGWFKSKKAAMADYKKNGRIDADKS